ncbi:hypothetical protein [Streptomyces sp. NPDC051546]|uniref:hypothetical protein n=1 Tax=Streptomyces sp. NPDC051546 TaxID=3365655 RepID=UPI0037AEF952
MLASMGIMGALCAVVRVTQVNTILSLYVAVSLGLAVGVLGHRPAMEKYNRRKVLYGDANGPFAHKFPPRVNYQLLASLVVTVTATSWLRGANVIGDLF